MTSWWRRRPEHLTDDDLSAYLDNETSSRETARFREHLVACDDCRTRLDEMRDLRTMLSQISRPSVPRSFVLSPEQAGEQSRVVPAATPQPSRWRVPAFVPAAALTVFLAVMALDLGGTTVSRESDSSGAAGNAPARAGYSADESLKSGETTTMSAPAAAPAPESAFSSLPAPVAPVAPSVTNSDAGAVPDTARSVPIPAPATGDGAAGGAGGAGSGTAPEGSPVPPAVRPPATGPGPSAAATPSTAQASALPPAPTISGDAFGAAPTDLAATNPDASSQIGIEPGQSARPGAARDDSGGIDGITVLEIVLFLVFLGSLFAVVWQRTFGRGVR